jgi:HEAT repeat protein
LPGLQRIFLATQDRLLRHLAGRAIVRSLGNGNRLYFYTSPLSAPVQARAIAWVLGETGDTGYSRQLRELLKHRDELTRARGAATLGRLPGTEVTGWLQPCRRDPHPAVRTAAEAAILRQQLASRRTITTG